MIRSSRKYIVPGDLVVTIDPSDGAPRLSLGTVISVMYVRESSVDHLGCEDRINVMWSTTQRISEMCDCMLVTLDECEVAWQDKRA